jgi:hypothetical protein
MSFAAPDVNADPTCARAQANSPAERDEAAYLDVLGTSGPALRAAENLEGLGCTVVYLKTK